MEKLATVTQIKYIYHFENMHEVTSRTGTTVFFMTEEKIKIEFCVRQKSKDRIILF